MFVKFYRVQGEDYGIAPKETWKQGKVPDTVEEMVNAVDKLDGARCSQMFLGEAFPDKPCGNEVAFPYKRDAMEISGGECDQYHCEIYRKDLSHCFPYDPSIDWEEWSELSRGAPTEVLSASIISKEEVIEILKQFAVDGGLYTQSSRLRWYNSNDNE